MGLRRPHAWEGPSSSPVTGEGGLDVPHTRMGVMSPKHWTAGAQGPSWPKDCAQVCFRSGSVSSPGRSGAGHVEDDMWDMQVRAHGCASTQGRRLHGTCVPMCVKQPEPHSHQHRRGCYPSLSNRCPLTRLLTYALKEPGGAGNGTREHPQLRHPARTARGNPGQAERPESATVTSSQLPAPP